MFSVKWMQQWEAETFEPQTWWLALVAQLYPTICDPMDLSPPGSSVHGIFQAGILEWVAISFSRGTSWPRDRTWVSYTAGRFFTIWAPREARPSKGKLKTILAHPHIRVSYWFCCWGSWIHQHQVVCHCGPFLWGLSLILLCCLFSSYLWRAFFGPDPWWVLG